MKRIILSVLLIGAISLTACGTENNGEINTQESESQIQETQKTDTASVENETEERLKTTDFSNLPKVAEKVGFSFRALESLDADDGEQLNPTLQDPRCFVSKEKINEIDVWLSEYILRFIPKDYELTEEDYALMENYPLETLKKMVNGIMNADIQ